MLDIEQIREQFPILRQRVHGQGLVYLDNAATTHKPARVIEAEREVYELYNSNVHRGAHHLSNVCTAKMEEARAEMARYVNASSADEVIFTYGATDGLNIAANGLSQILLNEGDEVLATQYEHHSNFVPWQQAALRRGARFQVAGLTPDGELDMEDFRRKLGPRTRIVAVAHASNTLGTVTPLAEVIAAARQAGAVVVVDGAQGAQHARIDVQALDADFYAFSAHKMYGPTGAGVLYGKRQWLEQMPPCRYGGEMIKRVTNQATTFNELPYKFEAGTPNYAGNIAMAEAARFISETGVEAIARHEAALLERATRAVEQIDGVRIVGRAKEKSPVLSFVAQGAHFYDIGVLLDNTGVAVRTGNHCTQPLMQSLGIEGTVRASFAAYNTEAEVDYFAQQLRKVLAMLR